ncbi:MmgE/PrpD family protein [Acidisphaera sp. L21]|uniref:MmgE/PrpD family protein n=1 Tax=Acidisphaera sp. L21 TaxID=1641851 RepID=UPI00131AA035|nr:MmgE/PrpD family protein [Acidisphaera sp. L21]
MTPLLPRRTLLAALAGTAALPAFAQTAAPGTIAEHLAAYADALHYSDLGPAIVELAKAHFIDAIGCGIGAFNEPPVRAIRDIALATSEGKSTVMGTTRRTAMDWASFANGAAVRNFDLNDVYAGREVGHPSDNITPCLAVAESEGRSGQDLILAMVLAYEINCRLLDAAQITIHGWDHPNYSLPAASLAAGKLMHLTPAQLAQAVNLSFAGHLAFNQTRLGVISNWKGLADADSGRSAVFAAQLARGGITGPAPVFEGKAGFFADVSGPFTLDVGQFGGRGGTFKITECAVKLYPAQALLQTAIVAAAKIGASVPDLAKVKSIVVGTTLVGKQYSADSPEKWAPKTSETADHSLPYAVARSLLDREITSASYSPQALNDPKVLALLAKLTVEEDPALTKIYPQKLPTRVTVTLDDGRVLAEQVDDLPGFGGRPMTRDDVEAKFRRNVKAFWPEQQIHDFLGYAWDLDHQDSITGLFPRMVVTAG